MITDDQNGNGTDIDPAIAACDQAAVAGAEMLAKWKLTNSCWLTNEALEVQTDDRPGQRGRRIQISLTWPITRSTACSLCSSGRSTVTPRPAAAWPAYA